MSCFFFFFNDTATTEIYTLSLHDALPISRRLLLDDPFVCAQPAAVEWRYQQLALPPGGLPAQREQRAGTEHLRSEEHTSELQSPDHLACRLLLEKKKYDVQSCFYARFETS